MLALSDCRSGAIVAPDATIGWLCAPRLEQAALLADLLDPDRGGRIATIVDGGTPAGQQYAPGTLVAETDIQGPTGLVRITDCLVMDPRGPRPEDEPGELIRQIRVVEGTARVTVHIAVRYGFGQTPARWTRDGRRTRSLGPGVPLDLDTDVQVRPYGPDLAGAVDLTEGQVRIIALRWNDAKGIGSDVRGRVAQTEAWWRGWGEAHDARVEALLLRGLTFAPTGGVVRSLTSSLGDAPADGRLCWMRDQERALAAYEAMGAAAEARHLTGWIERAGTGDGVRDLAGLPAPGEQIATHLARPLHTGAPAGDAMGNLPYAPALLDALS